eukprot:1581030-Alexandrium_andersonii.AAC.1
MRNAVQGRIILHKAAVQVSRCTLAAAREAVSGPCKQLCAASSWHLYIAGCPTCNPQSAQGPP